MTDFCKTSATPWGSLDCAAEEYYLPKHYDLLLCHRHGTTPLNHIVTPSESAAVSMEQ